MAAEYRPNYLAFYESGELEERVQALEKLLLSCTVCPLDCGNNRVEGARSVVMLSGRPRHDSTLKSAFVAASASRTLQADEEPPAMMSLTWD